MSKANLLDRREVVAALLEREEVPR